MDTMRKMMLLACGLAACICVMNTKVTARVGPGAGAEKAGGDGAAVPLETLLRNEDPRANIYLLPPGRKLMTHVYGGSTRESVVEDQHLIYSNRGDPLGQQSFVYRPSIRPGVPGLHIADDLWTDAVNTCEVSKFQIRVNGGASVNRAATFDVTVALSRTCPSTHPLNDQDIIEGTEITFTGIPADVGTDQDLVVDFNSPLIGTCEDGKGCILFSASCTDGSICDPRTEPLLADPQVYLRVNFTNLTGYGIGGGRPGWLVGWPPLVGFSSDLYDHRVTGCNTWFGGFPGDPHASFFAQIYAPTSCPTHFLAYLAIDAQKPAYVDPLGGNTGGQYMADDIELIVDDCELSAIYVGTHGTNGQYQIDFDLRVHPSDNPLENTERHWESDDRSGDNNMELARLDFSSNPEEIVRPGQKFWIVWKANKDDTGVINAQRNQAGGQSWTEQPLPIGWQADNHFFGWHGPNWAAEGEWNIRVETADGRDAVFFFAVYCRGEAPRGPCCMAQFDLPDQDPACVNNTPVTSCLEGRWLNDDSRGLCDDGTNCDLREEDACPLGSCDAPGQDCCTPIIGCPTEFNTGVCNLGQCDFGTCEDGSSCGLVAQDCPGSSCAAGFGCICSPLACTLYTSCPDTSCAAGIDCGCSAVPCDTTAQNPCPDSSRCIPDDPWAEIGRPACGTHACCKPDSNCEDLPRDDCIVLLEEETGNPARWNRGDFCGVNGQECPWFACYDASIACSDCNDPFHACDFDQDCIDWLQDPDAHCILPDHTCAIPKGCSNLWCCDTVCDSDDFCCTYGWDCDCDDLTNLCTGPPANNSCYDPEPGFGAIEIRLEPVPQPFPIRFKGDMSTSHAYATIMPGDPPICCLSNGIIMEMPGTVWYKFTAKETGSVLVQTCDTPGSSDAKDSVIQVFHAPSADIGICEDGSQCSVEGGECPPGTCAEPPCICELDEKALCQDLQVEGCNDDAGCGIDGRNAEVCISNVIEGDLYYVVVGLSPDDAANQRGEYKLTVEQPCPSGDIPQEGSLCETALEATASSPPSFDLEGTTLSCPAETCRDIDPDWKTMTSDLWYYHHPDCTGLLFITTCDTDPTTPEDDTTLALYEGYDLLECPQGQLDFNGNPLPLDCNDDAPSSAEISESLGMPQYCAGTGVNCDDDTNCPKVCEYGTCAIGECSDDQTTCTTDADCDNPATCTYDVCTSSADCEDGLGVCTEGTCTNAPGTTCTTNAQCGEGTCFFDTCTNHAACAQGVCNICSRATCVVDVECEIGTCYTGVDYSGPTCFMSDLEPCESGFHCLASGGCERGACESICSPGSLVQATVVGGPGAPNSYYTVRVGGSAGSIPSGQLTFTCIDQDCNFNFIPDPEEILNCEDGNPLCLDCNGNGKLDSCDLGPPEFWEDCNRNGRPDRCEIRTDSTAEGGPFYCNPAQDVCDLDDNNNGSPDSCDCPDGTMDWNQSIPPSGVVDARQPHTLEDGDTPLGINQVIEVRGPVGAPDECFTLCETRLDGTANDIFNVTEETVGFPPTESLYSIILDSPLAAGADTYITYTPDWATPASTGIYTSLPADSDGSRLSDAVDIGALVSCCLNETCSPPYGDYSCDINHSGAVTAEDVLRLIDLLNGGVGEFEDEKFEDWNEWVPKVGVCLDDQSECVTDADCAPAPCVPVCVP